MQTDFLSLSDIVESRLLLETEFADALTKARHDGPSADLQSFPPAMCALDLQRAQQMRDTISPNTHDFQQMMNYILLPRPTRLASPLF